MFEFSKSQTNQLKARGISISDARSMIANINQRSTYCQIHRPASLGDGITEFTDHDLKHYVNFYDDSIVNRRVIRFIPASGMATRMFDFLFPLVVEDKQDFKTALDAHQDNPKVKRFIGGVQHFPFYEIAKEHIENEYSHQIDETDFLKAFVAYVVKHYANKPKAFVPFHKYNKTLKTAIEEQLNYAIQFSLANDHLAHHFTVTPGYENAFDQHIQKTRLELERAHDCKVDVDYSVQEASTDSLVMDSEGRLLTDDKGQLVFRAAGHGSLIQNLNRIEADIVFINNIDNVAPQAQHEESGMYKRALAGFLLDMQQQIFRLLRSIDDDGVLDEAIHFLDQQFHFHIHDEDHELRKQRVIGLLDRPLRVCGMVPNSGEPGGGPFWVKDQMGVHLQIVEKAQVNVSDSSQAAYFQDGTHFNPVELVCSLMNHKGEKYDLTQYVDPSTFFAVSKTMNGKPVKAMEHPGLWNGAMAFWNTLFVSIPPSMFTPVKEVNDLLRKTHQNQN